MENVKHVQLTAFVRITTNLIKTSIPEVHSREDEQGWVLAIENIMANKFRAKKFALRTDAASVSDIR